MKTKFIFLKGNIILNAPMFARVKLERNLLFSQRIVTFHLPQKCQNAHYRCNVIALLRFEMQ